MSWLNNIMTWFDVALVSVGSLTALGLIGFFLGWGPVLKIVAVVADVLSPLFKGVVGAVTDGARWVWDHVIWPGLKDIADSFATICTVCLLGLGAMYWGGLIGSSREVARCEVRVERIEKTVAKSRATQAKKPEQRSTPNPLGQVFNW